MCAVSFPQVISHPCDPKITHLTVLVGARRQHIGLCSNKKENILQWISFRLMWGRRKLFKEKRLWLDGENKLFLEQLSKLFHSFDPLKSGTVRKSDLWPILYPNFNLIGWFAAEPQLNKETNHHWSSNARFARRSITQAVQGTGVPMSALDLV